MSLPHDPHHTFQSDFEGFEEGSKEVLTYCVKFRKDFLPGNLKKKLLIWTGFRVARWLFSRGKFIIENSSLFYSVNTGEDSDELNS